MEMDSSRHEGIDRNERLSTMVCANLTMSRLIE